MFDWLEGEGGIPEKYAGGPGALGVGAAPAGGRRVWEVGEDGAGVGERCEKDERQHRSEVGGRGGHCMLAAAMRPRRRRRQPG